MNCPVCKRELAPTLSICLTCGAMMNDTVREELETKIGKLPPSAPIPAERAEVAEIPHRPRHLESKPSIARPEPPQRPNSITAELKKRETSPTLVEFQHKNSTLPDWRLQLQNSIRKRNGTATAADETAEPRSPSLPASGSVSGSEVKSGSTISVKNEKVANALKRIEESRRIYSSPRTAAAAAPALAPEKSVKPAAPSRSFPFDVVPPAQDIRKPSVVNSTRTESPKPQLVSPFKIEKKKFDTNKLPPIPEPETPLSPSASASGATEISGTERPLFQKFSIRKEIELEESADLTVPMNEEIDDLAPLSMRFGAAVFDLIIGGFAAAILLSPFLLSNAELTSISGLLALAGAALLVMFIYLTATIAFMGRTFGMRLFSLEIIDAEANELPTLHQAAVNSAVYLLSLIFGGIGFLPALFNEERRTIHDMLSGTILIREY